MKQSRWYAIRIKPGYQRMAAADSRLPERRRLETVIEKNCREGGFEIFMPSFVVETKHHRTNKFIEKRFPLLVGYAFVRLPRLNFEELRKVEGVMCLLKINRELGPIEFNEDVIGSLMIADWESRQKHDFQRAVRHETDRVTRIRHLRGQLHKILPKGRGARISMTLQADRAIENLNAALKDRVLCILNELNELVEDDGIAPTRKAV